MEYTLQNGNKFSIETEKIFKDFDLFTRALIGSNDVDPTYPMIHDISELYCFEPKWFAFIYHSFYSLESAIYICSIFNKKGDWDPVYFRRLRENNKFSFGYERRGLRDINKQIEHLEAVVKFLDNIDKYLVDNETYQVALRTLPNNGGWASFKNAEIFEKALGYKCLEIKDLGIDHRDPNSDKDGPIPALRLLYGWDNKFDNSYKPIWNKFGCTLASEYGVSVGKIETSLCKFIKPFKGKYYIGHDIEEFHSLKDLMGERDWKFVMRNNFDERFWKNPVSKEEMKERNYHYLKTGEFLNKDFISKLKSVNVIDILLNMKDYE